MQHRLISGSRVCLTILCFVTQLLLSGYSQTEDIIVATMVNNRKRPELADVIGPFANNVALRTNLSGVPPSPFSQSSAQSLDRSARLGPLHVVVVAHLLDTLVATHSVHPVRQECLCCLHKILLLSGLHCAEL